MPGAAGQARIELAERLRGRRDEIEEAALARAYGIADPAEVSDPAYAEGLRVAVAEALEHGLACIESAADPRRSAPPAPLLRQARRAAHNGVGLDTVLRRYFAGHAILSDCVVEEAERGGLLRRDDLKRVLREQAALFDRLITEVTSDYQRAERERSTTAGRRRLEQVESLLAGELLDTTDLEYGFEAIHTGLVAIGPGVTRALKDVAASLERRLLLVQADRSTVWGWLGGRRHPDQGEIERCLETFWPAQAVLAIGEPAKGIEGWRLSHRQARVALPTAGLGHRPVVRYRDVPVLASAMQDELLTSSLARLYLVPISQDRDGGKTAKDTLRAYFATGRNVSSAASMLSVNRRTVARRLQAIEGRLDRPITALGFEVELALRLDELVEGRLDVSA